MDSIVIALLSLSLSPLGLTRDEAPFTVANTQQLREVLARAKPGEIILIAPGDYRGGLAGRGRRGSPV